MYSPLTLMKSVEWLHLVVIIHALYLQPLLQFSRYQIIQLSFLNHLSTIMDEIIETWII